MVFNQQKGECQVINAFKFIDKCALSTLTLAFSIKILDIVRVVCDTVCESKSRMNTIFNVVSIMIAGFVC